MTDHDLLIELSRQVREFADRAEILACVTSNSRGNDRFEEALTAGSYHADGLHEIRQNAIPGPEYGAHANDAHTKISEANLHNVTMHTCEIDGDVAHAESYVIGLFLDKDAENSHLLAGRYIDRLERRDGKWAIALRRASVEVVMEGRATLPNGAQLPGSGYLKGSRDRRDPAYERPLTLASGERW